MAVYMRVAEHFWEHCWTIIKCIGPEVGFLGRVGKPLIRAASHQGIIHA